MKLKKAVVKKFSLGKSKKLEFKFTRGSWENEALNYNGTVPENHIVEVLSDTTITVRVELWADQVERKIEDQITGTIQYQRNFQGEGIKPRDIIIWLPPNYDLEKDARYPVLCTVKAIGVETSGKY